MSKNEDGDAQNAADGLLIASSYMMQLCCSFVAALVQLCCSFVAALLQLCCSVENCSWGGPNAEE
jgi:hypothetical protein